MSSTASAGPASDQVGPFQLSLLVFSVVALAAIVADTFFALPREISRILQWVDLVACAFFFIDFVVRFRAAESKLAYMKWGWIDLIASIPNIEVLRLGRLLRIVRIVRLLRGVSSIRRLLRVMFSSRAQGGIATVALTMFLLVTSASIGVLAFETGENANIKTANDAVWWSVTTVTTVGYGDRYPVTANGRAIAIALMIAGVGMFGALSGIVASVLLGQRPQESELLTEIKALRARVDELGARQDVPPREGSDEA